MGSPHAPGANKESAPGAGLATGVARPNGRAERAAKAKRRLMENCIFAEMRWVALMVS